MVDYIGIAQNLKRALAQYAGHGAEQVRIDEAEAVRVLMEEYEIVRAMFRPDINGGFDYRPALSATATPQARLAIMAGAIDWILTLQHADAAKETTEEAKKRAHRRYADAVVTLSKAFALAAASDEAQAIRDEAATGRRNDGGCACSARPGGHGGQPGTAHYGDRERGSAR